MRVLAAVLLLLTSCLAPPVPATDAGANPEAGPSAACVAAGGSCVAAGPACVAVISMSISCGVDDALCCTVTPSAAAASAGDAAVTPTPAVTSAVTYSVDAGAAKSASGCDTSCEMTCEGDPNCIEMCGC